MSLRITCWCLWITWIIALATPLSGQVVGDEGFTVKSDGASAVLVLILFGAFCALWAQNTGRNAWLWFFLGVFFSFITVIVVLGKNSNDNFERRRFGRTGQEQKDAPKAELNW
ncbi:MAG: hypothetical protein M3463_01375 [Verrucomicrobiota bacterium]|nr:hypothetical protein [Verrucomicrobiota bacterium]